MSHSHVFFAAPKEKMLSSSKKEKLSQQLVSFVSLPSVEFSKMSLPASVAARAVIGYVTLALAENAFFQNWSR